MRMYKSSIVIILTLSACIYLYPEDEIHTNNVQPKDLTQINYPPKVINQNSQDVSLQTNALNNLSQQTTHNITPNAAYHFQSTEDYEATSIYGALPTHLSGLTIEQFSYDAHGQLVINENIKHIIEFFLMTTQYEGREQAIERLKEYINLTLPSDAATQALVIADNYLHYKNALMAQNFSVEGDLKDDKTITKVRASLNAKKALRRTHLGETHSESIFGNEERYDDYSVKRVEINSDTALSPEEKNRQLAIAENKLSPETARSKRYARQEQTLNTKISALQKNHEGQHEIYTLRKEFYGEQVANRMAYLEDNSGDWQNKVTQFEYEKQEIYSHPHLSSEEKQNLVQESRNSLFSKKEQIKYAVQSIRGQVAQVD